MLTIWQHSVHYGKNWYLTLKIDIGLMVREGVIKSHDLCIPGCCSYWCCRMLVKHSERSVKSSIESCIFDLSVDGHEVV